jgi:hypothetical protein
VDISSGSGVQSIVKKDQSIAFISGSQEVFVSNDNGVTWNSTPIIEYPENKIFYINDQFTFFIQSNENVYTSSDGASWNVNNYGYRIVNYLETSSGITAITRDRGIFKIGSSLDQVLDTVNAFREQNSIIEVINDPRYILNSENNFEVFGYFYDSLTRHVKGISTDGGDSWTFEEYNLPTSERNPTEIRLPYEKDGFKKYGDYYVAELWSNLRNNPVPHYSTDGGINWQIINDDNLLLYSGISVVYLE